MDFSYCWHRPGRMVRNIRTCRFCRVAIEECGCVRWRGAPKADCACEGSGWVAIVRSRFQAIAQILGIEQSHMEAEDRWE